MDGMSMQITLKYISKIDPKNENNVLEVSKEHKVHYRIVKKY